MRTEAKLEWVNAKTLHADVTEAIARHGGGRKAWHAAVRKLFPDFPAWRTLYDYTQHSADREKRLADALRRGLRATPEELTNADSDIQAMEECVLSDGDLYEAINGIIDRINRTGTGKKEIRLCAMHGIDQPRIDEEPNPPPEWNEFVRRMIQCIDAPDWRVEVLYNVPSRARLDQIRGRLKQAEEAENHEVRAYGIEGSLQILCPMIIGDRDAFLGMSHPRYYRTGYSLYIQGRDKITFIERYCKALWRSARIIRSEAGERVAELDKLEQEVNLKKRAAQHRDI